MSPIDLHILKKSKSQKVKNGGFDLGGRDRRRGDLGILKTEENHKNKKRIKNEPERPKSKKVTKGCFVGGRTLGDVIGGEVIWSPVFYRRRGDLESRVLDPLMDFGHPLVWIAVHDRPLFLDFTENLVNIQVLTFEHRS